MRTPLTQATALPEAQLRCCPWELGVVRQHSTLPLGQIPPERLIPLEGSLRHAILLCGAPSLSHARERMFDAADEIIAGALDGRPPPPPPAARSRLHTTSETGTPAGETPSSILPRDPFRAPPWNTADGRRSDIRWPTLTRLNWLLPLSAHGEAQLANGTMIEDYWNLGYRARIPRRLA